MAARKTKVDLSKMSPEERAAYEEKRAKSNAPRPLYITHRVNPDTQKVELGPLTRNADELLAFISENRDYEYTRSEVK